MKLEDAAQGLPRTGAQLCAAVNRLPESEHIRFYESLSDAELEAMVVELDARDPDAPKMNMGLLSDEQLEAVRAGEWPEELNDARYWLKKDGQ